MVYPYRSDSVKRIAETFLTYKHHFVKRAAFQLLARCPSEYAKPKIRESAYHVDPNISSIALYFLRLYEDLNYANEQLTRIISGRQDVIAVQRNLSKLYVLSMNEDGEFLTRLSDYIQCMWKKIKSERLAWHYKKILSNIQIRG